jgi:hypothetical protein
MKHQVQELRTIHAFVAHGDRKVTRPDENGKVSVLFHVFFRGRKQDLAAEAASSIQASISRNTTSPHPSTLGFKSVDPINKFRTRAKRVRDHSLRAFEAGIADNNTSTAN